MSNLPHIRPKRATGGRVITGPLHSDVGGRTDHLSISVPVGAYVIPADIVSALGEGNTNAGMQIVEQMFGRSSRGRYASGGSVPIAAAGGEYVISPDVVAEIGGGDLNAGHETLDLFIKDTRKNLINDLQRLPGPAV